jgi:hypothetical protein
VGKWVLTIISCKVRAADNTASRLFYHLSRFLSLSLSLNHHNPHNRHRHSFLSLSTFISFPTAHFSLFFSESFLQVWAGRQASAVQLMMMIMLVCLSSLSSLLLAFP